MFCFVFIYSMLDLGSEIVPNSFSDSFGALSIICEKVVAYFPWILRTGTSKYHSENTKGDLKQR